MNNLMAINNVRGYLDPISDGMNGNLHYVTRV